MELFIQIRDGQPFEHPIFGDNFRDAFPNVDTDNLPPEFARFVRMPKPELDVYQVFESDNPVYQKINGIWQDVWLVREMTPEEKIVAQQTFKNSWNSRRQAENWSAWVFDEATCTMIPPIPRPEPDPNKIELGIKTYWCGAENTWKDTPPWPNDGNKYIFDFFIWQWVLGIS